MAYQLGYNSDNTTMSNDDSALQLKLYILAFYM